MIDEARTLEIFGYNVKDLAPQSHKRIIAICEECGNVRVTRMQTYTVQKYPELCQTCIYNNPERSRNISTTGIGRHPTDETRAKMSASGKKRKATPETLERMRIAHTGIMHTQEAKDKISAARTDQHPTDETRAKMSASHEGMALSPEWRENVSKSLMGHGVSPETRAKTSGENHYNWKGGITPVMKSIRMSMAYKNWRKSVFERDNYTCQMCNVRGGRLQAHHIEPIRDNKNTLLIFDIDNGITLCKDCHCKVNGKEYDFIEQFKNIVENINKTS